MKSIVIIILFFLVGEFSISQNIKDWISVEKNEFLLKEVECKSPLFINILDSIIEKEKICEYYNDSLPIGIFYNKISNQLDISIFKKKYLKDKLQEEKPKAFFKYNTHICFIFNTIEEGIFFETGESRIFVSKINHQNENCKIPIIKKDDDIAILSQWIFLYYKENFYLVEENRWCRGIFKEYNFPTSYIMEKNEFDVKNR